MTTAAKNDRIVVWDKSNLMAFIEKAMKVEGPFCDLNFLDVSNIKDFKSVFYRSGFMGNISEWDMSAATTLDGMFEQSKFNGDISKWNVSNVTSMVRVFNRSQFDGDISNWDTSKVVTMEGLFWSGKFNGDISKWNVGQVTNMCNMFDSCPFKGDLSRWDVSKVTTMAAMFSSGPFDGDISNWDVSSVTDFAGMFASAIFQGNVSRWNTSNAVDMSSMFAGSAYRSHLSDVSKWNVEKVKDFRDMWNAADGPRDLSAWRLALDAITENMLGPRELLECDRPNECHWRMALEPDSTAVLRKEDQAFLERNRAVVSGLCDSTQESASMLQRMWLQEHGLAMATVDSLPLPEMDPTEGIGV